MQQGILCAGAIVHDTLVKSDDDNGWGTNTLVESIESHVGGNAANTSLALGTLGAPVRILGWIGPDEQGQFLETRLQNAGVDTSLIRKGKLPTAATVGIVHSTGQRKFLHRPGVSQEAFTDDGIISKDLLEGISHFHLCSLYILPSLRDTASAILKRVQSLGIKTSLDTNWDPLGRWLQDIESCLPYLNYLFMNEDEMKMLTGTDHPVQGAEYFQQRGVENIIVKLGAKGCFLLSPEQRLSVPAFPVKAVDTTGAGDTFTAGFLHQLNHQESLEQACIFANAAGALSVQKMGGLGNLGSAREVTRWIQAQAAERT